MKKKIIAFVTAAIAAFTMVVSASADDALVYGIPTFEGVKMASDTQYVNGNGIQRMGWNNAGYGNFTGSVIAIEDGALVVTGGTTAKGFQIQDQNYAHDLKINLVVGKEYKIVMEASAVSEAGIINIVPDNHPEGVAKTFDLTTEKTTYENTWTQVEHQYNDLQISSNVDFKVYSIMVYDTALITDTAPAAEDETAAAEEDEEAAAEEDAEEVFVEEDAAEEAEEQEEPERRVSQEEWDAAVAEGNAQLEAEQAEAAVINETAAAGSTEAAATSTKGSADTGIEGVAIIAGLALIASGTVVISRKRK